MSQVGYANVEAALKAVRQSRSLGRVIEVSQGVIRVSGLGAVAAIGDRVRIGAGKGALRGEVAGAGAGGLSVLPDGPPEGIRMGDPVVHLGPAVLSPDDSWIGRVVDPDGKPLDGRPLLPGLTAYSVAGRPPEATRRRAMGARVETGQCIFNTMLPLVRGQRIGLFAGSGVGKSTLLAAMAQKVEADVVVLAMVGERGREVREFIDRVLGPAGMARSVIVAATSDQPAVLRRRCAQSAMTIAEHFRDAGRHVLLLTDSVTRFADAHREIALARGETGSYGGYPPSMTAEITALCERAGPGTEGTGDITAIFSVLVAGSDMEGPVADTLRGVLDGHILLDREIAERGRFPAVDVLRSVSRSLPYCASDQENTLIAEARRLLGAYQRSEMMIQAGLYAAGSDRTIDSAILAWPKLDEFFSRSEPKDVRSSFVGLARCLSRRAADPSE